MEGTFLVRVYGGGAGVVGVALGVTGVLGAAAVPGFDVGGVPVVTVTRIWT